MRISSRVFVFAFALLLGVGGGTFYLVKDKEPAHVATLESSVEEKPIVVVTASYNNAAFAEKNVQSVLDQKYGNFRWVYIDDASDDETYAIVEKLVAKSPFVSLQRNARNQGHMANIYRAVMDAKPHEIVVILDGDDWFLHECVLDHVNRYYANQDVWMTYGQHVEYPNYRVGLCKEMPPRYLTPGRVRKTKFVYSHLRTFYAGLFHRIRKEDLQKDGRFIDMAVDVATMFPMLEMAGGHAYFVRELLLVYNQDNPRSCWKKDLAKQREIEHHIRRLMPYKPLQTHPSIL